MKFNYYVVFDLIAFFIKERTHFTTFYGLEWRWGRQWCAQ